MFRGGRLDDDILLLLFIGHFSLVLHEDEGLSNPASTSSAFTTHAAEEITITRETELECYKYVHCLLHEAL
eukprot:scaffold18927_cov144-Skeletonema_marinoi.AAC.1